MNFKEWLRLLELTSGGEPMPVAGRQNPYTAGKWSTSAFVTGIAKVKRNPVSLAREEKKKNDQADGYNQ